MKICKDKTQADSWFLGLEEVISRSRHCKIFSTVKTHRGAQSCINSPASFMRRKQILGLSGETNRSAQVFNPLFFFFFYLFPYLSCISIWTITWFMFVPCSFVVKIILNSLVTIDILKEMFLIQSEGSQCQWESHKIVFREVLFWWLLFGIRSSKYA